MSLTRKPGRRMGSPGPAWARGAAGLLVVALFAGCGGAGSSGTGSGASGSGAAAQKGKPTVSAAALQNTVDEALITHDIKASSLPPLMRDSLERATPTLTSAQIAKAYECWKATSCTLGNGPLTLAQVDTFGGNTWRQFTKMSVILDAITHPEIGKFIYSDAKFNLATYQANLRTAVAQGAKAIVTNDEFGPAAYAALAAAQRNGAHVSTYVGAMDDAPPNTYTTRVQFDLCNVGKAMADITKKATSPKGPIAYFEGLAGNPQDAKMESCVGGAGVQTVFKDATQYTPAGTQKAASALIASGKPAKAILYSYANTVPSIVNAYRKAGKPVPAIVTLTQSNQTACQQAQRPYPLYFTSSANWAARIAVNASVEAASGGQVPKSVVFPLPFIRATASNCDKSKPAEFPGPSLVPDALTGKMLAGQ
jgi:ABC-type sugar transport system substrate-binding protein